MLVSELRRRLAPHLPPARPRRLFAVKVYREHLVAKAKEFGIALIWTPTNVGAHANLRDQEVHCKYPTTEADIATLGHEIGHCVAPKCGSDAGHHHDGHGCLKCETVAWATAMALVRPFAWSARMHRHLMHALGSYRRTTPSCNAVRGQVDALATKEFWYAYRLGQRRTNMRDQFTHIGDEEVADGKRGDSSASVQSFRRHLRTLKTPPKGASLQVLRLWHAEHMRPRGDAA